MRIRRSLPRRGRPGAAAAALLLVPALVLASTRAPVVAGRFYPDDPVQLAGAVDAFLDDAVAPRGGRPLALVAPHAGYVFSGQIAADAYRQAAGHAYDLVVILGVNHRGEPFEGMSVYDGDAYRTPLGPVAIDREAVRALLDADRAIRHRPDAHAQEHSVEVHLPFVQTLWPEAEIVAAVVGRADRALATRLGRVLAQTLGHRRVLVVASSDLSHYPRYDDAVASDTAVLQAIASLDTRLLDATVADLGRRRRPGLSTCACGLAPVMVAMSAARRLGARHAAVVSYANSGDTALGDRDRVVGYGAVALLAGDGEPDVGALARPDADVGTELTDADASALLAIARETIARYLDTGTAPLVRDVSPALCACRGAFVTLEREGRLRGCIGHLTPDRPLGQVVGAMALQAAVNDRRFPPLGREELDAVTIEVSVLTPPCPVRGPEAIVVGRDGVVLRQGKRSAVYLPQVAAEQGWDRAAMLTHLCRKAGLPDDAWRRGVELLTFQARVIHEADSATRSGRPDR